MPLASSCTFCEIEAPVFQRATVLGRFEAAYRRCSGCGHVWVDDPHWLASAHADSDAIAALDTGVVERNIWLTDVCTAMFRLSLHAEKVVDFGGGTGLFTRMMRDRGFDCRWSDPWCENLFARGFEAGDEDAFDVATSFEVIEHSPEPMSLLRDLSRRAGAIFLSTELMPAHAPHPGEWWYYALETGQHVSFVTRRSLEVASERLGLRLSSAGSLHLLSPRPVSERLLRLLSRPSRARRLALFFWKGSLSTSDGETLRSRLRGDVA